MFKSLLILGSFCACGLNFNNSVAKAAAHAVDQNREFNIRLIDMKENGYIDPNNVLIVPPCEDYYIYSTSDYNDPNQCRARLIDGARIRVTGFISGDHDEGTGNWCFAKVQLLDIGTPREFFLYMYG